MSKRTLKNGQYISDETVSELNDQHGWFQYEDAQSDVSRAFANNAVHAFLEIAKDAEQAKQETGMTPMELVSQIYELKARITELEKDAARLNWMQENYICADFRYGEPAASVIVVEIPRWARVCGDLRVDVDTAMQKD